MVNIPEAFTELLDKTDIPTKEGMLELLLKRLKQDRLALLSSNPGDLIDYVPDFIQTPDTDTLVQSIVEEIEDMLPKYHNPTKIQSQWLSLDLQPYSFGNKKYNARDLKDYPSISKLLDICNENEQSGGQLNSCLVNRYSCADVAGRLHADDEDIICQNTPIVTVSLGAPRTIDFAKDSKSAVVKTLTLEDKSAFVMKPGCQQTVKHRLNRGAADSGVRYSISFRKAIAPATPVSPNPILSSSPKNSHSSATPQPASQSHPREPLVILAGDSIFKGLKCDLLGKKRTKVVNIAHGGDFMYKTEAALSKFADSLDGKYEVQKVFLSIGTNDIRYCKGVNHLRGPLKRLIQKTKSLFPGAVVLIQSVLPSQVQNDWTVRNVNGMNRLIRECCHEKEVYFVNFFQDFLLRDGRSNRSLFADQVHPNRSGLALIASRFIRIIHQRAPFDPYAF